MADRGGDGVEGREEDGRKKGGRKGLALCSWGELTPVLGNKISNVDIDNVSSTCT